MRRHHRTRRRALAVAFALAAHATLLGGLVLGRRPEPRYAEAPALAVWLVTPERRPPERDVAPVSAPSGRRTDTAPRPVEAPRADAVVSPTDPTAAERGALFSAPFAGAPGLRLRRRCLDGRIAEADREACERLLARAGEARPTLSTATRDEQGAYERASRRKAAIKRYKDSRDMESFPGLRCSFGRDCEPYSP